MWRRWKKEVRNNNNRLIFNIIDCTLIFNLRKKYTTYPKYVGFSDCLHEVPPSIGSTCTCYRDTLSSPIWYCQEIPITVMNSASPLPPRYKPAGIYIIKAGQSIGKIVKQ